MLSEGHDVEQVVAYLRQSGCSKVESIGLLVCAAGLPPEQAKEFVHRSPVWSDVYERDEAFQAELMEP
jgi:hypothetical protein